MQARAVRFSSPSLEGRLAVPDQPRGLVVLCHAYPPGGGSMSNPLIPALQRCLFEQRWASLRFNFRGVGRSEGTFDGGIGETSDARAALAFARREISVAPAVFAGWSFGSIVALRAAALEDLPVIAIAPPVSAGSVVELPPFPAALGQPALVLCGTNDPVSVPADARAFGEKFGAKVAVIDGADHYFEDTTPVCALVNAFLARVLEGSTSE